jgi:hypothetical protein
MIYSNPSIFGIRKSRKSRTLQKIERLRNERTEPIQLEHYHFAIEIIGKTGDDIKKARLKIAITILFLTGLRVGQLLYVQADVLDSLFEKQRPYIIIDRVQGGVQKTKAFVSAQLILKELKDDYRMLKSAHEETNQYLFPSKTDKTKTISREHFTK